MQIIGISGKIGTGKTTLANHLVDKLGDGWRRVAYGDALKQEVSDKFRIPIKDCYENKENLWPGGLYCCPKEGKDISLRAPYMSVRGILQWWGTMRRKQDPNYWVRRIEDELFNPGDFDAKGVVIDDVRLENEAQLVKDTGGRLIRLNPYIGWECDPKVAEHESETTLDGYKNWDFETRPVYGTLELLARYIIKHSEVAQWTR